MVVCCRQGSLGMPPGRDCSGWDDGGSGSRLTDRIGMSRHVKPCPVEKLIGGGSCLEIPTRGPGCSRARRLDHSSVRAWAGRQAGRQGRQVGKLLALPPRARAGWAGWLSGEMLQRRAAQLPAQLGGLHYGALSAADLNLGTCPGPAMPVAASCVSSQSSRG